MSIRTLGTGIKYDANELIEKCIGMRDQKGRRFSVISLSLSPHKYATNGTKRRGAFEDTMIIKTSQGVKVYTPAINPSTGKERTTGSLEYSKDPFLGTYKAKLADTPQNRKMLAYVYYDQLDIIDDPIIEAEIKKMADAIDEENKKIPYSWERTTRAVDPKTGIWHSESVPVTGTLYDYHKERRSNQFNKTAGNSMVTPIKQEKFEMEKADAYQDEIERLKKEIEELKSGIVKPELPIKDNVIVEDRPDKTWNDIKDLSRPRAMAELIKLGFERKECSSLKHSELLAKLAKELGIEFNEDKPVEETCQLPVIM